MGRASRAGAAKHHRDVVEATARLLRERGNAGVSVQDVMAAVGLTHGGFYKHFASKDELMGIATDVAFAELLHRVGEITDDFPDKVEARHEMIAGYLSTEHRDSPGTGCPGTALAGDAARVPDTSPLRQSYVRGVEDTLQALAALRQAPGRRKQATRRQAVVDFATLVGALTLARATRGAPVSDEILDTVRKHLDVH
jgi:TetR/AcrR family transcriptional repressor of nem operon